jgi:hypothetical protein
MIGGRLGIHYAVNGAGEKRRNGLNGDGVSPWRDDVILTSDELILIRCSVGGIFFFTLIAIGV